MLILTAAPIASSIFSVSPMDSIIIFFFYLLNTISLFIGTGRELQLWVVSTSDQWKSGEIPWWRAKNHGIPFSRPYRIFGGKRIFFLELSLLFLLFLEEFSWCCKDENILGILLIKLPHKKNFSKIATFSCWKKHSVPRLKLFPFPVYWTFPHFKSSTHSSIKTMNCFLEDTKYYCWVQKIEILPLLRKFLKQRSFTWQNSLSRNRYWNLFLNLIHTWWAANSYTQNLIQEKNWVTHT